MRIISCLALLVTILAAKSAPAHARSAKPNAHMVSIRVGARAPDFTLPVLGTAGVVTDTVRLHDLAGAPVVLVFWASWCPSCQTDAALIEGLHADYAEKGLRVVGVNFGRLDHIDRARAFVDRYALTYAQLRDESGDVANAYRISGVPTLIFIDAKGVIRKVQYGNATEHGLDASVRLIRNWK